jgi:hypothetical protein
MKSRFEILLNCHPEADRIGDVGHFCLPYLEQILESLDDVRVICLMRDREETIDSFLRWIADTRKGRPVTRWAADRAGFDDDPSDLCFPKYATRDMQAAIGRYWDEYYEKVEGLAQGFPDPIRIFPMASALNDVVTIRELLCWIGIPAARTVAARVPPRAGVAAVHFLAMLRQALAFKYHSLEHDSRLRIDLPTHGDK